MVVPVLSHEVKARCGYFTFSRTQLPVVYFVFMWKVQYAETMI